MKGIAVILYFLGLSALGGCLSQNFYQDFIENELVGQSQRVLSEVGLDEIKVGLDGHFLDIPEDSIDKMTYRRVVEEVDETVPGIYTPKLEPIPEEAAHCRIEVGNTQVLLIGQLDRDTAGKMSRKVAKLFPELELLNHIATSSHYAGVDWTEDTDSFLETCFTTPGVDVLETSEGLYAVEGYFPDPAALEALKTAAADQDAQFQVMTPRSSDSASYPDVATLTIQRQDGRISLSGKLPNEIIRDEIVTTAQLEFGTFEIDMEIEVSDTCNDPWWRPNLGDLLDRYARLLEGDGQIAYGAKELTMSGTLSGPGSAAQLEALGMKSRPRGYSFRPAFEAESSVEPTLTLNRSADELIISGQICQDDHDLIMNPTTLQQMSAGTLLNQVKISPTTKAFTCNNPGPLLILLSSRLENSEIQLDHEKLIIKGTVADEVQRGAYTKLATSVIGQSHTIENRLTMQSFMLQSETEMVKQFKEHSIYFKTGSSQLSAGDLEKVNKIADLIRQFPTDQNFIVGGYADQRGNPEVNRQLSEKRASAVMVALAEAGVPLIRMTQKSFTEDASGSLIADLWKSRRVEISLDSL